MRPTAAVPFDGVPPRRRGLALLVAEADPERLGLADEVACGVDVLELAGDLGQGDVGHLAAHLRDHVPVLAAQASQRRLGTALVPPGATVDHMLMEADDQKLLMASDAGYGFICTFNDLVSRNRAGKALISLPDNAHVMPPLIIENESDMLLAITAAGRMLMFPVSDLPELSKGKGNKIISIPSAEAAKGVDGLAHLFLLPPQSTLTIHVGKRKIKLRPEELQKVVGERGRRGSLMRGLQRIDRVEIDSPGRSKADDSEE